ncbi:MAG: class I SAM-dependent methyltransferase [Desulfobacteraceae bacterium]|nr:class I SAM-dependent methyltransferase [Desulfobacteraceae bacterium]
MTTKDKIRTQFNQQADQFSGHSFIRNQKIFAFIYQFCGMQVHDTLLDVACGSGAFVLFCGDKVRRAAGCDLSDDLLKIARNQCRRQKAANLLLCQSDAEHLPYKDNGFSMVTCRSAFHH